MTNIVTSRHDIARRKGRNNGNTNNQISKTVFTAKGFADELPPLLCNNSLEKNQTGGFSCSDQTKSWNHGLALERSQ